MKSVFCNNSSKVFNRGGYKYASCENNERTFDFPENIIEDQHPESVYRTARYMQNTPVKIRPENNIHTDDLIKPADE